MNSNTNKVARRSFLAASGPAATLAVADPSCDTGCRTHPATKRMALACVALEEAMLDYLDVSSEVADGGSDLPPEVVDHFLFGLRRLREDIEGNGILSGEEEVERRRLALTRKLMVRRAQKKTGERCYLQAEAAYYSHCRRDLKTLEWMLAPLTRSKS